MTGIKKATRLFGGGSHIVCLDKSASCTTSIWRYNNHHHNNNCGNWGNDIICIILQHEGCICCKYTPAVSKKELSKQ